MIVVGGLMLSHVLYPVIPRLSLKNRRGRGAIVFLTVSVALLLWNPQLVVFPIGVTYITYGIVMAAALGLLERLPDRDPLAEELEIEETEVRDLEYEDMRPRWESRRSGQSDED